MQSSTTSIESLIQSIQSNPADPRAYCTLARSYRSAGEFRKSELTLRRAIEICPLHHEAWVELGRLYCDLEKWRSSADAFESACSLSPADSNSWISLGTMRVADQDIQGAAAACATLLEKFPDRSETYLLDGHLRKISGQPEAAAECYRRALRIDARQTEAIFNLVDLAPPDLLDPLTARLEELRCDPSLSQGQTANICFALARVYESANWNDEAFRLYQAANTAVSEALQFLGRTYVPNEVEVEAEEVISTFGHEAFVGALEPLDLDIRFIFIVGLPRSGTTLAEQILSGHSRVSSGGELPFMRDCLAKLRAGRRALGIRGPIMTDDKRERELLLQLREYYLDHVLERELDAAYIVDKLPANFAAVGLIRMLFSDAIIVHCTRDPVATCWSLYCSHFGLRLPFSSSLEGIVHYHHVYAKLMKHWKDVLVSDFHDLCYEKLVEDPEATIRELVTSCGLPYEEVCLRFCDKRMPIYTVSMQQARRPIYSESVSRWRRFEKHLATLLEGLGET